IQSIGNLHYERQHHLEVYWNPSNPMFQRHAIQKLHCNESLAILLPDIVDCADVGVIQCGCRLCLALETSQGLRVSGNIFWQEFECDKAMQPSVLGLVNHTHAPAAQLFD